MRPERPCCVSQRFTLSALETCKADSLATIRPNAILALLFIIFGNRMGYDNQYYLADVHRYDSEAVSARRTPPALSGSGGSHVSG
jgi:hypothetical protein